MSEQASGRSEHDEVTDRIITCIKPWTPAAAAAAPLTADGLRDALRKFARQFDPDRRIAGRFEAGALVVQHIGNVATKTPPRPAWMPQPAVPGLPIVQNDNLLPDEWRLIDTDGGVMSEGRLEWKP
ncbi:hypothetical protein AB0K35_28155 [Micromonospora sp. NPDC053740]|uniref:hypothetical protein n=1 Tax=Micromonospora sp. NPDC053740 TaxID=3155173 RepID=UPI003445FF8C